MTTNKSSNKLSQKRVESLVFELSKLNLNGTMITTRALIIWCLQDKLKLDNNIHIAEIQIKELYPEMFL